MDDLEEARRLMSMVANQAGAAGPIEAITVINMAKVWAHIALAEEERKHTAQLARIADELAKLNAARKGDAAA